MARAYSRCRPLSQALEGAILGCGLLARCRPRLATLSGDQRNRAALAALILVQYFLLLDEPTNNLDMPSAGL